MYSRNRDCELGMRGFGETVARSCSFAWQRKNNLREEFGRVALPHMSQVYTAAVYLTRDQQEAEDLLQETYLRAFRFFHKFTPGTNARAWLLAIMRNVFINRYRRKKQKPETIDWEKVNEVYETMIDEAHQTLPQDPEQQLFATLMDDEVEQALNELPEDFRLAVTLVDVEELTYEEAATVMECPIGTVRSRVSRGRRLLQVRLKDYASARGLMKE